MISRQAAEALIVRYFETMGDAARGADFYALHTPDASLLVNGRPVLRSATAQGEFAEAHRAACEALAEGAPAFPLPGAFELANFTPDPLDPGLAVAWARHDAPMGGSVWVAFGIDGHAEAQVAWVAIAEQMSALTFGLGRALGVSEFPFLAPQAGKATRSWLDVAYRRRFPVTRPELTFLEDARFSCQGTGDCCKMTWEVEVEPEGQTFLDAIPWAEVAPDLVGNTQLTPAANGKLLLKRREETCRFIDEQNRCRIHMLFGAPVFTTCTVYPYRFTETPDGVAVSTSFYCGTARNNLGLPLSSQAPEVYKRLAMAGMMGQPETLRFNLEKELDWPTFRSLEEDMRATLRRSDLDMHRRLWLISRRLENHLDGSDASGAETEHIAPLNEFERSVATTYHSFLMTVISMLTADLACVQNFAWAGEPLQDTETTARWFEAIHYGKDFAYRYDLVTAHTLTVVLYTALLAVEQTHGGRIPAGLWAKLGMFSAHQAFVKALDILFEKAPFLRGELASPNASQLFLRLVLAPQAAPAV